MAAMSDYLEVQLINHLFRTATFSKPAGLFIGLTTVSPSDSSTGASITEVTTSASAYARLTLNPADAAWNVVTTGGTTANTAALTFAAATASWGTVTSVVLADSATAGAGNIWFYGDLVASRVVSSGDSFSFAAGALQIQLDN